MSYDDNSSYRGYTGNSGLKLPSEPKPGQGGAGKLIFWAIIACLIVGGAAWWLFSPQEKRDTIREEAADTVNKALDGTPLAGMGDVLRQSAPPPPDMTAAHDQPENSTNIAPDISKSAAAQGEVVEQQPLQPISEDATVRPAYIAEVAGWLASHYRPGTSGGNLAVSAQSLNAMGAVAIAGKVRGGRASLLRYAFQPSMIQGLYNLYIDRFMEDLNNAAQQQGFSAEQNRQFHLAIAGKASLTAAALEGIAKVPDLGKRLGQIDGLAQKTVDINDKLTKAVFDLDQMRESRAQPDKIAAMQAQVDRLAAQYRGAMEAHDSAQLQLANEIRRQSGQSLDNDSLLFLAAWFARRAAEGRDSQSTIRACSQVLRDLAARCAGS